ncbi:MAG: hypothetical protein D6706_07435 [Chloroflexi bacterium]|nr:MAG: hypothetical protein D6706_07435 [Chloroflexota bacterium]
MTKRDRKPYEIKTKIAGVSFDNDDGSSRQEIIRRRVRSGQTLRLIREPGNKYDRNAIGVWVEWKRPLLGMKRAQVGHIGSHISAEIAPLIDAGWTAEATVMSITGGTRRKNARGVNIKINMIPPE